ncbi:hypothetical protein HK100_008472, partial [Physocladia obscura]
MLSLFFLRLVAVAVVVHATQSNGGGSSSTFKESTYTFTFDPKQLFNCKTSIMIPGHEPFNNF